MPDITNDELARRLADMRDEVRGDLAEIRRNQERYVLREVHDVKLNAINDRFANLERATNERFINIEAGIKAHEEQRRGDRRWLISAIVIPTVSLLVTLFLALKGP